MEMRKNENNRVNWNLQAIMVHTRDEWAEAFGKRDGGVCTQLNAPPDEPFAPLLLLLAPPPPHAALVPFAASTLALALALLLPVPASSKTHTNLNSGLMSTKSPRGTDDDDDDDEDEDDDDNDRNAFSTRSNACARCEAHSLVCNRRQ
jgi:hypothetical protein